MLLQNDQKCRNHSQPRLIQLWQSLHPNLGNTKKTMQSEASRKQSETVQSNFLIIQILLKYKCNCEERKKEQNTEHDEIGKLPICVLQKKICYWFLCKLFHAQASPTLMSISEFCSQCVLLNLAPAVQSHGICSCFQ